MKKLTLKRTKWSKLLHGVLVFIIIAGFICTAASFTQAITTSDSIVSRVVNRDAVIRFATVGFVSLGITGLALLLFAFSTAVRGRSERDRVDFLVTEVQTVRNDINKLKKKKEVKSKKNS